MQPEIWKDIPGYEGRYQASTEGQIRSVDHYVRVVPASGTEAKRMVKGRILRPGSTKTGHLYVVLGRGTHGLPVHQLIARTFIGSRPDRMDVCHIDGNPTNNKLSNLKYDTRTNNILDVYRQGKRWKALNTDDVLKIRSLLEKGLTGQEIAKQLGVSNSTVSAVKTGRCYSWLNESFQLTLKAIHQ